jgi:hypothetical protein
VTLGNWLLGDWHGAAVSCFSFGRVWAFKANAEGARTDLILGEPFKDAEAERASDGLVLTEWKHAKTANTTMMRLDDAKQQAAKYFDLSSIIDIGPAGEIRCH